jgi:hypothetical protein
MAVRVWINNEMVRLSGEPGSIGCVDIHFAREADAITAHQIFERAVQKATGIELKPRKQAPPAIGSTQEIQPPRGPALIPDGSRAIGPRPNSLPFNAGPP